MAGQLLVGRWGRRREWLGYGGVLACKGWEGGNVMAGLILVRKNGGVFQRMGLECGGGGGVDACYPEVLMGTVRC